MPNNKAAGKSLIYAKGEMSELIQSFSWQETPLGPSSTWPDHLLNAVNLMLDSGFPMFIWWGEELRQFYNDAYKNILGTHGESKHPYLLGQPGKDHWPEVWQVIWPLLKQVLETGKPVFMEDRMLPIWRQGKLEEVYWTFSYSPIRDAVGKPEGVLVVCTETTRQNQAQKENARQQDLLLSLSDQLSLFTDPDAMEGKALEILANYLTADRFGFAEGVVDKEQFLIRQSFNKSGLQKLGGTYAAELFGDRIFERLLDGQIISYAHISKDEELSQIQKQAYAALRIEAMMDIPLLKNGQLSAVFFAHHEQPYMFTAAEQARIGQAAGRAWDAVLTARAERELRLSELRYRTLFDSIDEAFMLIEFSFTDDGTPCDYRFLATNPAFEKQTGLQNVIGKTILEIMPGVEPSWINTYGQVAVSGEALRFEEFNEGTGGWYDVYAVAVSKNVPQVVVVFNDITQRKLEEQRKNDFLSMASHELKTPLTSVNGYLHILKKKMSGGDLKASEMVDRTIMQIGKMTGIINSFLNIARLESGQLMIERRRFDIVQVVSRAEEEAINTNNSHQFKFEPIEPAYVNADEDKINQVIENFISNAVKYSPAGSLIQLACIMTDKHIKVSITDQGNGLDQADLAKVFNRFYRVEGEQTATVAGFGIGLYICREIIDRHGGQIGVQSELGRGSTFWFSLPIASN